MRRRRFSRGSVLPALVLLVACSTRTPSPAPTPIISELPSGSPIPSELGAPPSCPPADFGPVAVGPWWEDRVFYEVFVRSFADSNGDGTGDLAGLTARLDYLNDGDPATTTDLGVTGLWLMPIFESGSYHGYDTIDYERIESDYGDRPAFQAFLDAAHRRGIKVLLDLVINHTSDQHPWFRDALAGGPHRDWYVWRESDPHWPGVAGGSPWHQSAGGWYYGAFGSGMPDLNPANPAVTAEATRIATAWLDAGVDGFRLDAAKHLIETGPADQVNTPETHAWLQAFRASLHATHPDAMILGEVWEPRATSASYVTDGALDVAFDFGIGPSILSASSLGDGSSMTAALRGVIDPYPIGGVATFLANHDQPRAMTVLHGDAVAATQAAAALLTGPGVPFLYYGEELGMRGTKPDEQIRTPLPWTADAPGYGFTAGVPWEPLGPGAATDNVATETADRASVLSSYRDLVRLRAAQPILVSGAVTRLETDRRDVAATLRSNRGEEALVIQNLGDRAATNLGLTLPSGSLCGQPRAALLYGSAAGLETPAAPVVTPAGGLDGYVPLSLLPARSTVVIALTP